jgi:hypothetical protein
VVGKRENKLILTFWSPKLREIGKKVSINHLITTLLKRRTDFILWINFYFVPLFTVLTKILRTRQTTSIWYTALSLSWNEKWSLVTWMIQSLSFQVHQINSRIRSSLFRGKLNLYLQLSTLKFQTLFKWWLNNSCRN